MSKETVLCHCKSDAVRYAAQYLSGLGLSVTIAPSPAVTHLLLPVPYIPTDDAELGVLLSTLPVNITVSGGNLPGSIPDGYRRIDFLQDARYLAENAALTAKCTAELAETRLDSSLDGRPVLILGWGRIGKCLGKLLREMGADVTIAARKESDRAMIHALGSHDADIADISALLSRFPLIVNTIPAAILSEAETRPGCIIIDLASIPGITGKNVIHARGLPGRMAPAASGKLIAETFIRLSLKWEGA